MSLQSLKYARGSLQVLDQLLLPNETLYIDVTGVDDAWSVIRKMQVRGAPLIAITAALGLAVELSNTLNDLQQKSKEEVSSWIKDKITYLRSSRPTAVNLFLATDELASIVDHDLSNTDTSSKDIINHIILSAEALLEADVATNKAIGLNGAKKILEIINRNKVRVLTICNTGSLATAGYGFNTSYLCSHFSR